MHDMKDTTKSTLAHYEANADAFEEATRDHDVSQNLDALVSALPSAPPQRVLDFGCGPGRDLIALTRRGHVAVGLDGCARFVEMARRASGCEVLHQDFLALDLAPASFDGIFANASLFHVPSVELPRVLGELRAALRPNGVLVCSNPRGSESGEEGYSGGRWCCFFEHDRWLALFEAAGFREVAHFRRPTNEPLAKQRWLVMVLRADSR
jgi:SAM-dependent methyltransferase